MAHLHGSNFGIDEGYGIVADAGKRDWDELITEYGAQLMEGLSVMGTRAFMV